MERALRASGIGAIVPAFKLGRTQFYEFVNPLMAPYQRVLETMVELECVSMKFTRAHLEAHFEACDKFVIGQLSKEDFVKHLVDCYDRLTYATAPETILRALACWFFTRKESPYVVDPVYNERKIELFLKYANEIPDVFFSSINSTKFPLKLDKNMLVYSTIQKSMRNRNGLSSVLNLSETHSLNKESNLISRLKPRWTNIITGWWWK